MGKLYEFVSTAAMIDKSCEHCGHELRVPVGSVDGEPKITLNAKCPECLQVNVWKVVGLEGLGGEET